MAADGDAKMFAKYFDLNGYACPLDVLSEEEVNTVREHFDKVQDEIGKDNATYSLHNKHLTEEWVLRLTTHPNMLKPLKAILGNNLILLDSRFICKYPVGEEEDKEAYVAWHQDVRYWGVEGDVVSVWLAVDNADKENACMQVIPGTHKSGILEHVIESKEGNLLSSNQAIPENLYDISKAEFCPLKAGQMSLHHGHLVHGSGTNRSNRRRCGYVIRYVSTDAKPIEDPNRPRSFPATVLVSGVNESQNFEDHAPAWYNWRE
ncbi:probable alpha-ketoglutarate-dependent hypophosphite dioxygenase [Aplysia californica]|uniref:Probable alpha-ketoglutarate-dependent hypophosphite dioxygenase n=1 Tax=Aplysia californica TaxID=6500 RepID=A0ABM0ZUD5_APLCA|nr:probable alpha-ketoglutarate-dependent hypophosphite dioxygenase [Aplysia californica]